MTAFPPLRVARSAYGCRWCLRRGTPISFSDSASDTPKTLFAASSEFVDFVMISAGRLEVENEWRGACVGAGAQTKCAQKRRARPPSQPKHDYITQGGPAKKIMSFSPSIPPPPSIPRFSSFLFANHMNHAEYGNIRRHILPGAHYANM